MEAGLALGAPARDGQNGTRSVAAAEWARWLAEAQRTVLGLRANELAPGAVTDEIAERLLSPEFFAAWAQRGQAPHTTHLSVATADGSAVAITMSLGYGAGIVVPGTGIALNNGMGEPERNRPGVQWTPGTRLPSNMAPTVAWNDAGEAVAMGSPGASRIVTAIAQTWLRHGALGMLWPEAVAAPRLHVEEVAGALRAQVEPGIDSSLLSEFVVRPFDRPDMYFGAVQLAARASNGALVSVADARRSGTALIVEK
jgi:gamma-glutamyltranspeptidase/glutathione hydrolase